MKSQASGDILIGGSILAAAAFRAGLVDESRLFVAPHIIGAAKRAFPDGFKAPLALIEQRRFDGGVVYLRHALDNTEVRA